MSVCIVNQGVCDVLLQNIVFYKVKVLKSSSFHLYWHPLTSWDLSFVKLYLWCRRSESHDDVDIRAVEVELVAVSESYNRPGSVKLTKGTGNVKLTGLWKYARLTNWLRAVFWKFRKVIKYFAPAPVSPVACLYFDSQVTFNQIYYSYNLPNLSYATIAWPSTLTPSSPYIPQLPPPLQHVIHPSKFTPTSPRRCKWPPPTPLRRYDTPANFPPS